MSEEKERPAYVRFEQRSKEDRAASQVAGHPVFVNVEMVLITPPGSKDEVEKEVAGWLDGLKVYVKDGRMSEDLASRYAKAYEFWKRGMDVPLDGTPIKGWPVLSAAQQKACIEGANIRTVEDLSGANAEAMTRMGMGANEMKQKAIAWLKASASLGTVVMQNSALLTENAQLKSQIEALLARNAALAAQIAAQPKATAPA